MNARRMLTRVPGRPKGAGASRFIPVVLAGSVSGALLIPTAAAALEKGELPLPRQPYAPIGARQLPTTRVVVPMVFPVIGPVQYVCSYNHPRAGSRHTGVDIAAPKLRPIVAAISGTVWLKTFSFWIVGEGQWEGWTVLGTHLNDDTPGTRDGKGGRDWMYAPNVRSGDRVQAGQLLGYVGDSGNATGPHLHFELYGRRGVMNPLPSLASAQRLSRPKASMVKAVAAGPGSVVLDGVPRGFDPKSRVLTIQIVARQSPAGQAVAAMKPWRYRVRLTQQQVESLGGWAGIRSLSRYRPIQLAVTPSRKQLAGQVLAMATPTQTELEIAASAATRRPDPELRPAPVERTGHGFPAMSAPMNPMR